MSRTWAESVASIRQRCEAYSKCISSSRPADGHKVFLGYEQAFERENNVYRDFCIYTALRRIVMYEFVHIHTINNNVLVSDTRQMHLGRVSVEYSTKLNLIKSRPKSSLSISMYHRSPNPAKHSLS